MKRCFVLIERRSIAVFEQVNMTKESFKIVLGKLMTDKAFTVPFLCKRSKVSVNTLENWLVRGKLPRYWRQIVHVADALALSEADADRLLTAANKPTLSQLRQTMGEKPADIALLTRWQPVVLGLRRPPFCIDNTDVIGRAIAILTDDERDQPICLLRGMGGVGKTTLAQEIASRLRPTFTDGVLFIDLRDGDTARLITILTEIAHAHQIPAASTLSLDALSLRVRSALAGKNILIVLDDVRTREQIDQFRPDSKNSSLLLTTRSRAVRPPLGTQVIDVKPFDSIDQTLALFETILGKQRVSQEAAAFAAIARMIGNLPLAATIVAQRLAMDADWSAAEFLADELRPEHARLAALEYDDLSVRVSFNLSYQQLSTVRQRHFAQLGVFDGEPFTVEAAAHILALVPQTTKTILRELHHAGLLQKAGNGRYRLHQLLSQYAHDFLSGKEAYSRKIAYYIAFAQANRHDEIALTQEINNIRMALDGALVQQLDYQFVEGIVATYTFLFDRGLHEQVTVYLKTALALTEETASPTALQSLKGRILTALAHVTTRLNQVNAAHTWLDQAEPLADAQTQITLGRIKGELTRRSDPAAALTHWHTALTQAHKIGATDEIPALSYNLAGQYIRTQQFALAKPLIADCIAQANKTGNQRLHGLALYLEGVMLKVQGAYEAADHKYEQAHTIAVAVQNSRNLFMLLLNRGYLARLQGRYTAALRLYTDALSKTVPTMPQHLMLHSNIAEVLTWQGDFQAARSHLDRAFALLAERNEPDMHAILLRDLGLLEWRQKDDPEKARDCFEQSLAIAQAQNDVERTVQAQLALGDVYRRVEEKDAAEQAFTAALTLTDQIKNAADRTLATYGLAQLDHDIPTAEQCHAKLEKMGHYRAKSIQVWLRQNR